MAFKLLIDPGHGLPRDPGAVANGLKEATVVLKISKMVRDILLADYTGIDIKMTRDKDVFLELKERTDMANRWKADYFLSIHCNAGGGKGGFESFIWNGNAGSATVAYQNVIHQEIVRTIGGIDRGRKKANHHVTRESNMPALLIECLFVDVKPDANKLKDSAFLEKMARGIVSGIVKSFGLKSKPKPKNEPKSDTTLYKVQVGAYSDKKNAGKIAKELKSKGFDAIIVEE